MTLKEIFKPTKWNIILTILLFIGYILVWMAFSRLIGCTMEARGCIIDYEIAGAKPIEKGKYFVEANRVPFSFCQWACTPSEYYTILIISIFSQFVIPLLIVYVLVCFSVLIIKKFHQS